jgi:hypothetical protein
MFFEKEKPLWDPNSKLTFASTHFHMCLRGRTFQLLATPSLPKITFEFHLAFSTEFCSQKKNKKNIKCYFGPFLN